MKYSDGRGGSILLPQGTISFADEVITFQKGNPQAIHQSSDSSKTIGAPDYIGNVGNFTSLGCGGSLIVHFTDNAIVNVPGPDLYVFEVGKFIEKTSLQISKNGLDWIFAGEISGGVAAIDIDSVAKKDDLFYYVKLTDLKTECRGKWPGADIDAVGAIGSGRLITLNSAVLFDHNQFALKSNAISELQNILDQIKLFKPSKIIIEGHTDNTGNDEINLALSKNRAKSVAEYFIKQNDDFKNSISISAYGSSQPISDNLTPEGKEKNRRVSIILIP